MKLPSLQQAVAEGRKTFLRFPLVIINAIIGTIAVLILVDVEGPPQPTMLFNVVLTAVLGIPLLTALALLAEKNHWGKGITWPVQGLGVLLLVGYGFTVPTNLPEAPAITLIRFLILAVALHLLVAVAPYAKRGELGGFWHYNKTLFLRTLTSLLYTCVLWVGLAIALAALDNLFGVHIPGKRYPELWFLLNGIFMTWFFLAGVPENLAHLDTLTEYPKGLKVFAQYILLPLVFVYLIILYAYLAKIVAVWDWPQGWVSKLILGFSAAGMFSLLLLHPVAGRAENIWVKTAARWFYVVLIPLVVMLFLAVWRRVSEYGITEGRYLALALGLWLVGMIAYFSLSKAKSIKVIPASLCVAAFLVSFGPWGTFTVAERSQLGRLEGLLQRNAILAEGKVRTSHPEVPVEDARQISSILSYLHDIHGYGGMQPWFAESLTIDSVEAGTVCKAPAVVARMMGFEYVSFWQRTSEGMIFLHADVSGAYEVTGYSKMLRGQRFESKRARSELPGEGIACAMSDGVNRLTFVRVRDGKEEELLQIDVRRHVEHLLKDYSTVAAVGIPPEKMAICGAGGGLKVKVCPWHIGLEQHGQEVKLITFSTDILYSVEPGQ